MSGLNYKRSGLGSQKSRDDTCLDMTKPLYMKCSLFMVHIQHCPVCTVITMAIYSRYNSDTCSSLCTVGLSLKVIGD